MKFKLTKKKIVSLAIVAALLSIAAMGTLAYFTDSATAHNVITSGGIDITLNDKTIQSGVEVDFPDEGITGVMPSQTVDKIVSVTNHDAEAWVRIHIDVSITGADGGALPQTLTGGTPALTINYLTDNGWSQDGDYWYYATPVSTGATTATLFETVTFAPELGNEYQGCTVVIDVTAEAVQTANNPTATGWPEAPAA